MRVGRQQFWSVGILSVIAVALAGPALAQSNAARSDAVYTVGNYPVDSQAKNAVAAKRKALADGQEAAFHSLLKRVVPVTDYARLKRLAALRSSDFFEGVSVRSERNSSTRYIASLDFSFRAESVRAVLAQEGIPFVEEQAHAVIVVPMVRNAQGAVETGAAARAWERTWRSLDLEHTLTPMDVQKLKPSIDPDTLKKLIDGTGGERILAGEYGQPYVLVAIAEPDATTKRLNVSLTGIDAVGPINLKRSYKIFDDDTSYAMELAAVVGQGVIEGRWKAVKTGTSDDVFGEQVALEARYVSFAQWRDMRERLLELQGVNDVRVETESAQGAGLKLRFPGGGPALATALRSRGLLLEAVGPGWVLRSAN